MKYSFGTTALGGYLLPRLLSERAAVKNRALVDEKSRPYFTNEAIGISIKTQDSICVNLSLYMIRTK